MAQLAALRAGLANRLATVAGLRAYDVLPDQPELPAAIVTLRPPVDYHTTMGIDAAWRFQVTLLVSRWDAARAQRAIDPYVSSAGVQSVRAAIEGDITLGGVASTTTVRQLVQYGPASHAGVLYLGAEWDVEVLTSS